VNTSADQQDAVQQFRDKLIQAQKQLSSEVCSDAEFKQLSAFIDLLHDNAVPADLAMLEPAELKNLCQQMLGQIRQRQGDLNVRFFPINSQDQGILVCSCDEAPFLLDSLLLLLRRERLCWQVITHLRLKINRSGTSITTLQDAKLERANESLLIVQSEGAAGAKEMLNKIEQVLAAVLQVATDRAALYKTMKQLQPQADKAGHGSFWSWLLKDNFVPLSYRQLRPENLESAQAAQTVEGTVLGIGADPAHNRLTLPQNYTLCDMSAQACITQSNSLAVTQSSKSSPVWRNELLTYISLRGQNSAGENIVHDIAGLYTQHSRGSSPLEIDELRTKVQEAMLTLGIAPESYNYLKTKDLLSAFPITELFFLDRGQLQSIIKSLLFSHPSSVRIVLLDHDSRRLNLLLIVPHSLNPSVDFPSIETYLKRQCNAEVISSRVLHLDAEHFIVQVQLNGAQINATPDLPLLSERLTEKMRSWEQKLRRELILLKGSTKGMELWQIYRHAFCINYRNRVSPRMCMNDINMLELLRADKGEQITMWRPKHSDSRCFLLFYNTRQEYINELMPLLVNLDLTIIDEVDFCVHLPEFKAYIKSFGVLNSLPAPADLFKLKDTLIETLSAMRAGRAENDYLNHLVIRAGLDWQQVDMFRAYHNYYFQLGSAFTKRTVAFALINNPRTAMALYNYFAARFKPEEKWVDPVVREEEALHPARQELIESLAEVDNANEDSILRTMFNFIDSTVRTNFFIRYMQDDYFISLKISSIGIAEMPTPRPMYEVYVHNASMEGIHLRGGKVARGGIRWSDRPDDFRTEVLGLLKTQTTKNTLIVPMGSKGGFVVKTPFEDRNTGIELSKRAYQTFIRALLDLTDNLEGTEIVTPENMVCYDGDDPYLVVAADKGTALFSDTANAISAEYEYWLDDAFASGGSQGYDHKKLGITARGAWVNVKRHFREMGIDIQTEPFTVVGIGDMSGDVFGNAMLLSEQTKLCAAFNHRHIFIDPNPDPAISFAERKRLFELQRSSWDDYNAELISTGGGIFERHAKEIPLSLEVQSWLGVRHTSMTGDTLVQMLLQAPVDLLWNGGIGTYVKHSLETNAAVGDRANDNTRVDGNKLRARVVGEGGNLGLTQLGRIEYALGGGRINTDAVDNSGGVDCSDHEVNLKIFMQHLKSQGLLQDVNERNTELQGLTNEVCDAVLHNNYTQSLALSLDKLRNNQGVEVFSDLAIRLENTGLLNPVSEALPKTREVLGRKQGYTRPELAILLAYSKMDLHNALLDSSYIDTPFAQEYLAGYFPEKMRVKYTDLLNEHPLRREIIATVLTNHIIDQAGSTTCFRLASRHNIQVIDIVPQYLINDRILDGPRLRAQLCALDNKMPAEDQYTQLLSLETALANMCDGALRRRKSTTSDGILQKQEQLREYRNLLSSILKPEQWEECRAEVDILRGYGLDANTALELVTLPYLDNFIPLVHMQEKTGEKMHPLAVTMAEAMKTMQLEVLLQGLSQVPLRDRWDRRSYRMLKSKFQQEIFALIEEVMREYSGNIDNLLSKQRPAFVRYKRYVKMLDEGSNATFHPYMVVLDQLQKLR